MEIFKRSRLAMAKLLLRRRLKKTYRHKKFNNLRNAHKIGIVWDGSMVEEFNHVNTLYQKFLEEGIQVDVLCYFPGNVLPDAYTALRYMTSFKRSELNYLYLPNQEDVNEFISTPYEILIDINFSNRFPLYYVTALSKAEFKIGATDTINRSAVDMTIKIEDKINIEYYLSQVEHYLNMINTGV